MNNTQLRQILMGMTSCSTTIEALDNISDLFALNSKASNIQYQKEDISFHRQHPVPCKALVRREASLQMLRPGVGE